ncbi:MAG: hypothetical protein Q8M44_02770, partial [bacterium]|nr:hypothetical protein [bacterium]
MTSSAQSICNSPFSDINIAILRVEGIFAKIIFNITIIGTDKIIPTIHQIALQNHNAIIITRG